MLAFLIITSLSLAFYLVLLAALHRDSRKRRAISGSVRKVDLATFIDLDAAPPVNTAGMAYRQANSTKVLVRFAKPTRAETLKPRAGTGDAAEVITLSTLARGKNDLQCG